MRPSRRLVFGTASVSTLLVAWVLLTMVTGTISTSRFPSPLQFWQSTKQIMTVGYADGTLISHALHSIRLVVMGFAVAVGIGVPLGLLMGWSRRAEALINPAFLIIRPIPPLRVDSSRDFVAWARQLREGHGDFLCRVRPRRDQHLRGRANDRAAHHRGCTHAGHGQMALRDRSAGATRSSSTSWMSPRPVNS